MSLADDGKTQRPQRRNAATPQRRNLQMLCPYCNRVKGTRGSHGFRLKMAEHRSHNAETGVMVDKHLAVLTGKLLAKHHRDQADVEQV